MRASQQIKATIHIPNHPSIQTDLSKLKRLSQALNRKSPVYRRGDRMHCDILALDMAIGLERLSGTDRKKIDKHWPGLVAEREAKVREMAGGAN